MGEAIDAVGCSPTVGAAMHIISELEYGGLGSTVVWWGGHESHLKKVGYLVAGVEGDKGRGVANASALLLMAAKGFALKSVGVGLEIRYVILQCGCHGL